MCYLEDRVLIDPSVTRSFVSLIFAWKMSWQTVRIIISLSVAIPLSDSLNTGAIFLGCPVQVEGRQFPVELVLLDVIDVDMTLGIDWLS